ncbi:recombinase family protein [Actinoplanes sp. NPDC048791]|uniref:recombinase family protein n=1 Tax=Actinoplanes sp. NPDC048791 TaxID=3154623 RepID=UPI0033DC3FA2
MKTAVYCRLSQDRSGTSLGIERQQEDCRALVDRRGGVVVEEYVDNDASASSGRKRPAYERLLASVERGDVDAIAAWALDRLVRRLTDLERLVDLCDQHEVTIMLARGSDLDLSTPSGRLVARLLGAVSRHEVDAKSDRQRREARQRAERGAPAGGRRAFGYSRNGAEVDEREAPAVRQAYESLLGGRTLSGIAADLNAAGYSTTMGGDWKHNAVRVMLCNARNAGIRTYRGEVIGQATWPPIVSEEVYRAALDLLAEPGRRTNSRGGARRWLGTALYECGRCDPGRTMISTYRERYVDGGARRIYRCPDCRMSRIAEPVDAFVVAVIVERLDRRTSETCSPPTGRTRRTPVSYVSRRWLCASAARVHSGCTPTVRSTFASCARSARESMHGSVMSRGQWPPPVAGTRWAHCWPPTDRARSGGTCRTSTDAKPSCGRSARCGSSRWVAAGAFSIPRPWRSAGAAAHNRTVAVQPKSCDLLEIPKPPRSRAIPPVAARRPSGEESGT